MQIQFTRSPGTLCLCAFLILVGLTGLGVLSIPGALTALLALAAGILLLVSK